MENMRTKLRKELRTGLDSLGTEMKNIGKLIAQLMFKVDEGLFDKKSKLHLRLNLPFFSKNLMLDLE